MVEFHPLLRARALGKRRILAMAVDYDTGYGLAVRQTYYDHHFGRVRLDAREMAQMECFDIALGWLGLYLYL